jgi:hypothetical protein
MPAMANITVKKADGTTDIVYDAQTGAGSDGSPAVWRQDTGASATLPVGLRAALWLKSLWNGPRTARKLPFRYDAPYAIQDTTTTRWTAPDRLVIEGVAVVPQGMPPSVINEGIAQGCNLLASTLIKSSMQAGYAPNQ